MLSIRFFIGLATRADPNPGALQADIRAVHVQTVLLRHYDGATLLRGSGIWQGQSEPSVVAEVIIPYDAPGRPAALVRARETAQELARELGQVSVGLAFTDVDWDEVRP